MHVFSGHRSFFYYRAHTGALDSSVGEAGLLFLLQVLLHVFTHCLEFFQDCGMVLPDALRQGHVGFKDGVKQPGKTGGGRGRFCR